MLEVFCDSSFNVNARSFIGIMAVRDGTPVHESTTLMAPDPAGNLESELNAIKLGIYIAERLRMNGEPVVIYCDSTEAIKSVMKDSPFPVEFRERDDTFQSMADRLSKKMPVDTPGTPDLCRRRVFPFTVEILKDLAINKKPVLYLEKDLRESSNTKTCYKLVIRNIDGVISDGRRYVAKAGEKKSIKVAKDVSRDFCLPENLKALTGGCYFLITDETWGLRAKGDEAYSILPCEIEHIIICHEVDRSPENLFKRAAALK